MAEVTANPVPVNRVSALAGNYSVGHHGKEGAAGVRLSEHRDLELWQVAAWPETFASVAAELTQITAAPGDIPAFGKSIGSGATAPALLRTEPLKFWVVSATPPEFAASQAVSVDLSHSRTLVQLQGEQSSTLLNSFLPLDLRDASFPVGTVASTAFHHCGVTLWRSQNHYELFLPRGFALSLWELLLEGAMQYGFEIT